MEKPTFLFARYILITNLINEKHTELIELTFKREDSLHLTCNKTRSFFFFKENIVCGHGKKDVMLSIIFGQYLIRLSSEWYRQTVGIPLSTKCNPLLTDLFVML